MLIISLGAQDCFSLTDAVYILKISFKTFLVFKKNALRVYYLLN